MVRLADEGDGQEVGTIHCIGDEWLLPISIKMMGRGAGRSVGRGKAREAVRTEWNAKAAVLGPALAVARGGF